MRIFFLILLSFFVEISFAQTVEDLEKELSNHQDDPFSGNKKDIAKKLLEIDSFNKKAINYLVDVYAINNQRDSILVLFDFLKKHNPDKPELYLFISKESNAYYAGFTISDRIKYLEKAYSIDSTNEKTVYKLGKLYYKLFIDGYKKNKKNPNLKSYAENSSKYLEILYEKNEKYKETLKYPLLQLAYYLGRKNKIEKYENSHVQFSYFPVLEFLKIPKDWKRNYSVDVLSYLSELDSNIYNSGVESAAFKINWYSKHLKALEEPVLNDTISKKVYRFTWLRTFHHPIVIRIEKDNDTVRLYWKESDGAGGYEPGKIITDKSKILSKKDWKRIIRKVRASKFWKLPSTENEIIANDGAQWILEGKEAEKYHLVDRCCGMEIYKICLELLKLTDLKIKENEMY